MKMSSKKADMDTPAMQKKEAKMMMAKAPKKGKK